MFENREQRVISGTFLRVGCRWLYLERVGEKGAERYIWSVFANRMLRVLSRACLRKWYRGVYLERV